MNCTYFMELRSKEKINDLMEEGMRSQACRRSGASKAGLFSRLPKLILVILGIVGIVQMVF